ncbi:alpha/beta hydrolase [Actinophytocola xinjiangensis]|uniref:Alpha/beta hydrolase n=1 Tax=Actinophytocola xinjiangensis TaxID=485602 RepID=A0A7Z1AVI1_9PSEU|nr:alpha/beta hydrolase [Actinophytocola xinjiangensis]OLF05339.1 alpha/beta hydrolase [Actinophytocola xinjiangensis]
MRKTLRKGVRILGGVALAATVLVGTATAATAQDNPYERGPDPTESLIEASRGPFSVSQTSVSSLVSGFGGGTIYYPTSTSEGTFGAVAISPGFTATESSIAWMGPRLASHGFVVITIDTNTIYDQPSSRGDQLLAALDYMTEDNLTVRGRIDSSRLAVAGHSMGGGGSLEAASSRPALQAAVPLAPWNTDKSWSELRTPTLIIGGESDSIAPVATHSIPFYNSIPASAEKAYLELDNASHFFPQTPNTTQAKYMLSWLKRFVDNDTRYEQFLCPAPDDRDISDYRDTCPHA